MFIFSLRIYPKNLITILLIIGTLSTNFAGINFLENTKIVKYAFAQFNIDNLTTEDSLGINKSSVESTSNSSNINNQVGSIYPANFTRAIGSVSSVQQDDKGKAEWIISGNWELLISKPLKINQTNPPEAVSFGAIFESIKLDGTERHTHIVSDFNLQGSEANGNILVLTGTATVTMKEGAVKEVPVGITIENQGTLKLWIYPWVPLSEEEENYHFGKNPIYGMVS